MPPPRLNQREAFIKYLNLTADRLLSDLVRLNGELSPTAKRHLALLIDGMRELSIDVHGDN